MNKRRMAYAFDLDGTITKEEILPILAAELGLLHEMQLLTRLTLNGSINFEDSFRLRFQILKSIPIATVQDIVNSIRINAQIEEFIKLHKNDSFVITGNLDVWIKPLIERLGCKFYTSSSKIDQDRGLMLDNILLKSHAVREIKQNYETVVAIGESFNDIPMFEEADIGIAFGGVHHPVSNIIKVSDFVCYEEGSLCRLLNVL
ncbi:MAG: family hydrolase [Caproiciproducens sp.]|jgi:HAD superfamily phosphoserine phosphatase-like hydrolase|nr:family hydrolase [Clostridia bacterium]MDF2631810.1 family hydrolase [Caproiciproducens sp.]